MDVLRQFSGIMDEKDSQGIETRVLLHSEENWKTSKGHIYNFHPHPLKLQKLFHKIWNCSAII